MPSITGRANYRRKRRLARCGLSPGEHLQQDILRNGISWRAYGGITDKHGRVFLDVTSTEGILRAAFGPDWRTVLDLARHTAFPIAEARSPEG